MLEISSESILFDEVAVNDIPVYRRLHLRSTSESPTVVHLAASSTVVQFQLRNENYAAIQRVGYTDFIAVYNEAFDAVGLIHSVELGALEEKEVVVSFRADPSTFAHLAKGAPPAPFSGTLQFTAATKSTATEAAAEHTVSVPFRANVYVSFLKLSAGELQVTMTPNKTQVADFVVTNTSCQPVYFVVRDQAMPLRGLEVALYESDKFEEPKLGHRLLLDSYASMTFSLMIRSSAVQQQYHTVLQCDNLRDTRNTTSLYVSVNVAADLQGDLIALPDTSINFGDVYRGTKATASLRIQALDIREEAAVRLGDVDRRKCEGKLTLLKGDTSVDELLICTEKGNQTYSITLLYQPTYDGESHEAAQKKFDVELFVTSAARARSQRVVVRCTAVLYTSNIVVPQRSVNFGDCQVGQSKRYTLQIENHSPLAGRIVVELRSKIIQIEGVVAAAKNVGREIKEEFFIAPSASLSITLRITPQRVNPMYRKQLTIINASNPAEDRQVINIEANNMAPLDTKLHDELYSWRCDLGNIDGAGGGRRGPSTLWAISDVPLIVPYSVQSKVDREVVLNLCSSCPEIEVFYSADVALCEQLSAIAAEMRSFCVYGETEDASHLTNESAEQLFTAREGLLRLLAGTSCNVTNRIALGPLASLKAYVLIIRTASPTEPLTKEDGISIAVDGIEAPRFVRLSYRLCGTSFELNGQKTKNFGEVNIGVKKTTKLPIVNRCNSFLYLHLSKSRSVTAEHIRMESSDKQSIFLTIRPYASREIELTLYPGIKGVFQEKIRVANILNIQNTINVTLKATVTKADTFEISPDSWTFEMMVPSSASVPALMAPPLKPDDTAAANTRVGAKFTVSNTSNARRQIVARVELGSSSAASGVTAANPYLSFAGVKVAVQLDMTLSGATSVSTRKLEEQIEKLEQKLKIYVRKKKTEKAENAMRKIEAYRLALKGEEVDLTAVEAAASATQSTTDHELSESEDEGGAAALQAWRSRTQQSDIVQLLRREGVALPSMGAGESVMITLFLVCRRVVEEQIPATQTQTMNVLFYEARDQEANRIIPIDMILMRTPGDVSPPPAGQAATAGAPNESILSPPGLRASLGAMPARSLSPMSGIGELPRLPGDGAAVLVRTVPSRPAPTIRLTTSPAHAGGRRAQPTFMGHPLLVLRNCIVNDQTEFSFVVEANADTTIVVLEPRRCGGSVAEVLDARFKLFPRNGHVRQQEPLRIVVECTARSVGPQKYFIPVKNIRNAADVHYLTVEMNPTEEIEMLTTEPRELLFRDVITPCAASQLEAQLVLIRSRFPFPHALVVRTNKPAQLALFEDAACTVPLLHPIRRVFVKETVRVYVQLRPGARYIDPCARHIRAGVLVEAVAANPAVTSAAYCVVGKAVLRASACVGSGLVEVPQRCLELGCVAASQHFVKTHFTVCNTSHTFALRVALVPSSPLLEVAEETSTGNEVVLAPLQERRVSLVVHLPAPGLTQECIDVVNRSSAQEAIRVTLSALRMNDGIVQVQPAANTPLAFPVAAVVRGEQGRPLHLHQPVSCSIKMANYNSHREVVLSTTAISHAGGAVPLWFHTPETEAAVRAAFEEEQRQALEAAAERPQTPAQASESRPGTAAPATTPVTDQPPSLYAKGRVELKANHAQVVTWTLTALPTLTPAEVAAVLRHQMVTVTATLHVTVTYTAHSARGGPVAGAAAAQAGRYRGPTVGQCVLLVPVTLSLAMSEGRAEPAQVNLGLVGRAASAPASPIVSASQTESDSDAEPDSVRGAPAEAGAAADTFASGRAEEAVLAARQRRRRRSLVSKLRRPLQHTFGTFASKPGLQQPTSSNVAVSFRLVNLSPVMPLPLKVECPPVLRFTQSRLTIAPGETVYVEAMLNLKLIVTQGPFRYEAFFVNEWNPENDMAVRVTGQHYWKVFQVLRTDTQEEVRESLTLPPLRIEPSLRVPLAELKLSFVATEPDVELDLHLQPNPKLDGLLELVLLHYDATSAARHLSYRTEETPAAPASPPATAGASAAAAAALGSNAAGAGGAPSQGGVALAPPTNLSFTAAPLAGAALAAAASTTSFALTSPSAGAAAAIGSGAPLADDAGGGGIGVAGTAGAAVGGSSASAGTAGAAAAAGKPTAPPLGALKARKAGPTAGGAPTTSGAGTSSSNTTAAAAAASRSQTLRLRCLLRGGDLAAVVALFFGYRKPRAAGPAAAAPAATVAPPSATGSSAAAAVDVPAAIAATAAAGGPSPWTHDRIAELERRSAAVTSNNVWLGSFLVANPFTETEEVQVYGSLAAFRTITAPAKVTLRPSRVTVEATERPPASTTSAAPGPASRLVAQLGYVGEISLTNDFDVYVADVTVAVLVHERLAASLCVDVRGGYRLVATDASGPAATASPSSTSEAAREDEGPTDGDTTATATATSAPTPRPVLPVATSFVTDGAAPVSTPHCIHVGPRETVVLTVAIRPVEANARPSSTSAAAPLSLPSLEQYVSIVVVDENVPFNHVVSRINVVTPTTGAEPLPNVVLTSVHAAPASLEGGDGRSAGLTAVTAQASDTVAPQAGSDGSGDTITNAAASTAAANLAPLPSATSLATSPHAAAAGGGTSPGTTAVSEASDAVESTTGVGGAAAAAAARDAVDATGLPLARGATPCGSEDAAEMLSSSLAGALATTATTTTTTATASLAPRHWVLSLRHCEPLAGCGGAYLCNFSVPRGDTYDPNILITNHATDAAVRYTVQVVSQSPQVWLLLTSTSGVLAAGETQPLRVQVLSSEVGSFVGYVAITNSHDAREVLYLRLNAEVFVPGTAEGVFDVVAMNTGHRLATSSAVHSVKMGAVYGAGTCRSLIALEIVNKGSVALEFPVSVVLPMRQELRPIPPTVWYGTRSVAAAGQRRRPLSAAAAAALPPRRATAGDGPTAETPPTAAENGAVASLPRSPLEAPRLPTQRQQAAHDHSSRTHHHHHHARHGAAPSAGTGGVRPSSSSGSGGGSSSGGGGQAVPAPAVLAPASISAFSSAPFEGKLVVCQIHSAPTRAGQKYFVVDPRSPMRLAFVLSCNALRDIPDGHGVFGQADVVFRCKQARDAQFTFRVSFEAYKPTFAVALEYDMNASERAAAAALSRVESATAPNAPAPAAVDAAPSRWVETEVAVTNLSRSHAQVFVLYTQSEVLALSVPGQGQRAFSGNAGTALLPPMPGLVGDADGKSAVEVTVAPQSTGAFTVRLDRLRAEALLKFDKDESMLARPALCEHAYVYNKGNPRERVQLLFRQHAVAAQPRRAGRAGALALATAAGTAAAPSSPLMAEVKPVKGAGQHFSERHVLAFAQRFSAVLTSLTDRLPFLGRPEETVADAAHPHRSAAAAGSTGSGGLGGAGAPLCAGVGGGVAGEAASLGTGSGVTSTRHSTGTAASPSSAASPAPVGALRDRRRTRAGRDGSRARRGGASSDSSSTSSSSASSSSASTSSSASRSASLSDVEASEGVVSEADTVAATAGLDRTHDSVNTADAMESSPRDGGVGEEGGAAAAAAAAGVGSQGGSVRDSGDGTPAVLLAAAASPSLSDGAASEAAAPASSQPRVRSADSLGSAVVVAQAAAASVPSRPCSGGGGVGGVGHGDWHWRDALATLHDLLVELTWLCDELLFYAILLRNSRHVEACGAFLISAVTQHPVMIAWRRRRGSASRSRDYDVLGLFLDTLDALPRLSASSASVS